LTALDDIAFPLIPRTHHVRARPITGALVDGALFLTIFISPLVFIEPSPYDVAIAFLTLIAIAAGLRISPQLLPLIVLLTLWNAGGLIALLFVHDQPKTVQFVAVSLFLALSAVLYAALFSDDTLRRLDILRRAYILAALVAALIGIAGYFDIPSGAGVIFAEIGRAHATFKDPNVFGPFLILPLLLLLQSLLGDRIGWAPLAALLIILFGLFLSFSRGAWIHFALSAAVLVLLMLLTTPDIRTRRRVIVLVAAALASLAALFTFALSFDTIGSMFEQRARLVQDYDAGTNQGRFFLQIVAMEDILNNPWGLGPHGFGRRYGTQQHNVYLQGFLTYGWLGGFSYLALTLLTLLHGYRAAFLATPWQGFMIAALAAFTGAAVEGLVIDTDHWRHYFLLLGLIWGLVIASRKIHPASPHA
jgi:O-antigen ligase